jgi:hypothetical protein
LIKGVEVEVEAEEVVEDVGVCQKNYEELGPRGSAADSLLGEEIEGDPSGREEVQRAGLHSLPQRTNHPPFHAQPSNTIWPTSQASALLWGKIFLLLLLMSILLDNGVGTQQPTIDGSVEGGQAAAFKTSTTRRIVPPPLLLPLPGMHIQSKERGEEEEASKWKMVVGG